MDTPVSPTPSPFIDHAAPLLDADTTLSDQQRADLWDVFHQSKSADELTQKLLPMAVPDDTKHKLWQLKQQVTPVVAPVDKITTALAKMKAMDPETLDLAEAHPNVLKVMTNAALTPEKPASEPAGASSGAGKGKKASEAQTAAPLALPPRTDGLQHMPPIEDSMYRVLASNGSVHDLPKNKIQEAFKIDPKLHVLNP